MVRTTGTAGVWGFICLTRNADLTSRWKCPIGRGVVRPALVGPPSGEDIRTLSNVSHWDLDTNSVPQRHREEYLGICHCTLIFKKLFLKHVWIQFKKQ